MKKLSLACAIVLLAACSQESGDESTGDTESTVTILTHDSFVMTDELIAAFEEETGYTLETISPGASGMVLNQLILNKDNPVADGVYGIDTSLIATADREGVLADYASDVLPEDAGEFVYGTVGVPIDQGDVCINADLEWFESHDMDLPTSLESLAQPEYASLLVVTNPVTSAPGFTFYAGTKTALGDEADTQWAAMLEGGTKVAEGWSEAYYTDFSGSDGEGPFPLVLSYSSSPSAELDDDGQPRTAVIESTCVKTVEYASVVEGAANPEGAQAFIDFMLSESFQQELPDNMYMYPISSQTSLPEAWDDFGQLADDPILLDPDTVSTERENWLEQWTELVG